MKLFLDTANIDEIKTAWSWGAIEGVTTNPSLVAKEGRPFKDVVQEICQIVNPGDISAEVVSLEAEGMIREAREVASWHPNIVVKIPMTKEGMKAVKALSQEGIRCNVTLVFSLSQAFLAAKAGAYYISNFVGRVDDVSGEGMNAVRDTVNMIQEYGFKSQVLVASVRHPMHVVEALRAGAHACTVPFKVLEQLYQHPLTDIGIQRFLADWEKSGARIF
ncbi:MAG: fructose-6-phosphate aldolase [Armatimonadota bacterium]|nr:fructose-6-phosphate aldolase [bacterium]MDW8320202.1 fructose-6-phosphate aldolase [Armatimonadota bacterium]